MMGHIVEHVAEENWLNASRAGRTSARSLPWSLPSSTEYLNKLAAMR